MGKNQQLSSHPRLGYKKKIFLSFIIFFILIWSMPLGVKSQTIAPNAYFERISTVNGLSQNTVSCLLEDKYHFIWVGTKDGLNRYDGHGFEIFRHNPDDPNSISDNYINALYEDENGCIWVGTTSGGLNKYSYATGKFTCYKNSSGGEYSLSDNSVTAICGDGKGGLWVGTKNGLNYFNIQTSQFTRYSSASGLSDDRVNCLLYLPELDVVLVGTRAGINAFSTTTNEYAYSILTENNFNNDEIHSFYYNNSVLWVSTVKSGLYGISNLNQPSQGCSYKFGQNNLLVDNVIRDVCQGSNKNEIWVATTLGLNKVNLLTNESTLYTYDYGDTHSISDNVLTVMLMDSQGTLWIGTYSAGLLKVVTQKQFFTRHYYNLANVNSVSSNTIKAIFEDRDGFLYFGTCGGVDIYDRQGCKIKHLRYNPQDLQSSLTVDIVKDITQDTEGNIWIATTNGLNKYDPQSGQVTRYYYDRISEHTVLSDRIICSLMVDHMGKLWLGTYNGVVCWNLQTGEVKYYGEEYGLANKYVYGLCEDQDGLIWFGSNNGLYKLNPQTNDFTKYTHNSALYGSLSNDNVVAIYQDSIGNLWIGTYNGLNYLASGTNYFVQYNVSNSGLSSDLIYGIIEDVNGYIWVSTSNGLNRLNPKTQEFFPFYAEDGTGVNEFLENAVLRSKNGILYFGGVSGGVSFDPQEVMTTSNAVTAVITDLIVSGKEPLDLDKPIPEINKIELKSYQNTFSINFSVIDYISSHKQQIYYRLCGLEEEWHQVAANVRSVQYNKIDAGNYKFEIMVFSENTRQVTGMCYLGIEVSPKFYQTWWFFLLLSLFAASLLYGIVRIRIRLILRQKHLLEKKVAEQTELLQNEVYKHERMEEQVAVLYKRECQLNANLADEMRKRIEFNHALTHELKTPLTPIIVTSQMMIDHANDDFMLEASRNVFDSANNLCNRVDELLDLARSEIGILNINPRMMDFAQTLKVIGGLARNNAEAGGVNFIYEVPSKFPLICIDGDRLRQVVQNMLSNAHKFTPKGGEIVLRSFISDKKLYVEVENDGILIKREDSERIFIPHYQQKIGRSRFGGLGIGLALSRQFVRLHKGEMWLETRKRNVFVFYVPISLEGETIESIDN
ncbi:hypothetical protein X792_07155 [Dehalococcoides mccartyi CG1]|jgi:ligand-binding sensor domain-containing protein/signal transduction histidine kinase|uniref:ligand-binding sensor domain-containing protein n=1 Tax=Dehalococcoides mccartyi TaxID=61435 RepID=UPI0004E0A115|nr:two-component regulator propeller domain-containing protein [Dehalococcoides mccartyi]AII58773.1 hypothetical protein X792_07155 [Dehalococcoides mccartyi CG1]